MKCANCNNEFTIYPEDTAFYNKMKVPVPTWCPECRLIRRMVWRNERSMYKRKCDLCHKDIIAIHDNNAVFPVYCNACWQSDKWDVSQYAREYDFNKSFFEQLKELKSKVPKVALYQTANVNCPWVNREYNSKNCYLNVGGIENENGAYDTYAYKSKDTMDNLMIGGQLCYQSVFCLNTYKTFFSMFCFDCQETYFSFNCRNCSNIIGCTNLTSKSFYIFNKQVTKQDYMEFLKKYDFGKHTNIDYLKEQAKKVRLSQPHKYNLSVMSNNCTGDFIEKSKNCIHCFNVGETEDCKYVYVGGRVKDSFDICSIGLNSQLSYEFISGGRNNSRVFFSHNCGEAQNMYYSMDIDNSHDLFGCIGLRNKEYCILNKQYTKEDYINIVPKIKKHMNDMPYIDSKERVYTYGEFFAPEMSSFSYNETVAHEYFPLTKEQAVSQGYKWKEQEDKDIKIDIYKVPDNIKDVQDDILNKVIACEHQGSCNEQCRIAFKIIPKELKFYKDMNLPLPRLCPNCRHVQRVRQRNPFRLWKRQCNKCKKDIHTAYEPSRPEIVYCEECYNKEIL